MAKGCWPDGSSGAKTAWACPKSGCGDLTGQIRCAHGLTGEPAETSPVSVMPVAEHETEAKAQRDQAVQQERERLREALHSALANELAILPGLRRAVDEALDQEGRVTGMSDQSNLPEGVETYELVPMSAEGGRPGLRPVGRMGGFVRVSDFPKIIAQERERVCGELQDAFDHISNVESKLPGLYDMFDHVFPGWAALDTTEDPDE